MGGGETVESKSLLRQKKWYKTNRIKLKTQSNVEAIDTKKKTVTVSSGDVIKYDNLVIASGAIPRELPDTQGMGNAFTLRQPSDANAIARPQIILIRWSSLVVATLVLKLQPHCEKKE